jgi:hypothetical protein
MKKFQVLQRGILIIIINKIKVRLKMEAIILKQEDWNLIKNNIINNKFQKNSY